MNRNTSATPVGLDAQVVVNCYEGGSCNGGDPIEVYKYASETGLPHSSCEQYTAYNLQHACEPIDICRDCSWPPPEEGDSGLENCRAVDHRKYYVSDYFSLSGVDAMKAELYVRGSISCGIQATDAFDRYDGTYIYSEDVGVPELNHEISVVGWSVDENGREYWIGRNSWGTYWGDYGFFYMDMYTNNLGINTDCTAGIPTYDAPTAKEFTQ